MAHDPYDDKPSSLPKEGQKPRAPEFKNLEEEDAWIQANADFFRAIRFHGRGQYEKIGPQPSIDLILSEIKERGKTEDPKKCKGWLIYAVVNEGSRQTNVLSVNCKGEREEDYDEFRARIKREEKLARRSGASKNG
jgi:hypothetical protein